MDTESHSISPEQLSALLGSAMLAAAMTVYDALYERCRSGQGETHIWSAPKPPAIAQ